MRTSTYWKNKIKNILINSTEDTEQIVSRRMDYYFKKYYKAVNIEKYMRSRKYRWDYGKMNKEEIKKYFKEITR